MKRLAPVLLFVGLLAGCAVPTSEEQMEEPVSDTANAVEVVLSEAHHTFTLARKMPDGTWVVCIVRDNGGYSGGMSCDFDHPHETLPR